MFSNIGTGELVIIIIVALLIFGPKKLPDIARSFGKAINQFKKSYKDVEDEITNSIKDDENKNSQK